MTYTRVQAAEICDTSNRSISNWLKEFDAIHGLGDMLADNQITEAGLDRLKERAELGAAGYREKHTVTETPATPATVTVEAMPEGITAGIMRRADAANSSALAINDRTAALSKFEVPKVDLDIPEIDVEDMRALLGLSTSANTEADAHRANSDAYQKQLDTLQALQDELDEAKIIADEKARIAREKELRAKVRAAEMGNEIKASVAVA